MTKKAGGFNLSETIRHYRKAHRRVSAKVAFEGIKKAHPNEKINEGTFKSTFYKLAGAGGKKSVHRRRPARLQSRNGDALLRAGLEFIQLAGGVDAARERLVGLQQLIEVAKATD